MTTLIEIRETVDYEPTVQDKIQRVLYRLEHGEQLCRGYLHIKDKFCILGLFADESGLGEWEVDDQYPHFISYSVIKDDRTKITGPFELWDLISEYYNFNGINASFNINHLPEDLRIKLESLGAISPGTLYKDTTSLDLVNDILLENSGSVYNPEVNEILADIIRSGVIFKDFADETGG